MKRKRGNKKGKKKGNQVQAASKPAPNVATVELDTEDNSGIHESDNNDNNNSNNDDGGKDEYASRMEVDTPSSTGTDQPLNVASINPDGSIDKTTGKSVGRVKVKLKTSKTLESQSDTDKSSPRLGLEKQAVVGDKMEDSGSSLPEVKMGVSVNVSKKPGSIKIKSSKGMGSLSVEKTSNTVAEGNDSIKQKEVKTTDQSRLCNKEELDSALSVIKKVMKMDAAEPFNVPVNPEALGIPDYFDVIHTPMDFGTICSNLEKGNKYVNSEDVYKDVQYIWDNCYKYNNKGDYILDLMKRVKKNFMKYWTAVALYTEQGTGADGADSIQGEDVGASSLGNVKSGQLKQKTKKRHGRRHKADCLCAICVLKRRRREREESARLAKAQIGVADNKLAQQLKQEDSSPVESPHGEASLSDASLAADADIEVEEKPQEVEAVSERHDSLVEEKREEEVAEDEDEEEEEENEDGRNDMETQKELNGGAPEESQVSQRSGEELNHQSQLEIAEVAGPIIQIQPQEGPAIEQQQEEVVAAEENKHKESQERQKKAQLLEKFHKFENPMLLSLCETLFPENGQSVWSGPHSLFKHQASTGGSSIHAAINKLMMK